MSNYTQNVSYAPKDALTPGDPNKAILGSQIDAELSEISTAIASKEDSANKGQPSGYAPLNSSSLLLDSYLTTNIPRLDASSNIFTSSLLGLNNTNPTLRFIETDGAADNQRWLFEVQGERLLLRIQNDAASTTTNFLAINRTGTTVDEWVLTGSEWTFNRAADAATVLKIGEASTLRGNSADSTVVFYGENAGAIGSVTMSFTGAQLQFTTSNASSVSYSLSCYISSGNIFRIYDSGNTDYVTFSHDGTNLNIVGTNTTNIVVSGAALQASTIELGNAADTTLARVSAGVVSIEGENILTAATGKSQGRYTIPIMAAAMQAATTNGATAASVEAASGVLYRTLDFDQTTQEFAGFTIPMPRSWNDGTITFQPIWTAAAGTAAQTVDWALQAVTIGDDSPISATFGTEQVSSDALLATGDVHVGPESSAITVAGTPSAGQLVAFRIKRNVSTDNLAADARLIGIRIFYTDNAADDTP